MMKFASSKNYQFEILQAVENVNERQKIRLLTKMKQHFGSVRGKRIAVWGLAFKPKTDDMREAPAVPLIKSLIEAGASVAAYDPEAAKVARGIFGAAIDLKDKSYEALAGADGLAIVTEWHEFREPDWTRIKKLLKTPVIFDGRNIYNPEHLRGLGFTYYSMGRR
jgi:UDPglucose 6-dehydrogenase